MSSHAVPTSNDVKPSKDVTFHFRPLAAGMGQAVAERTILRKKENGEFEHWGDVADRVAFGNASLHNGPIHTSESEYLLLRKHLANGNTLLSGRHLQHGDANEKDRNMEIFTNCGHIETKFITLEHGVTTFGQTLGQIVTVRCSDGKWRPAQVKKHGKQALYNFTFRRSGSGIATIRQEKFTLNHRWLLSNGTVTDSLKIGDVLLPLPLEKDKDPQGVVHGLIFGDGCAHKSRHDKIRKVSQGREYCSLRVCKEDFVKDEIVRILNEAGYSYTTPKSSNGDPVFYIGKFPYAKEVPFTRDPTYIAGFIHGWWLADGSKTEANGTITISTSDCDAVDWLVNHAVFAGLTVLSHRIIERHEDDGSYKNGKSLHIIRMRSLVKWKLENIQYVGEEEVFCVEEPITKSFTLASALITGNCSTAASSFLLFYLLLNGSGVGRCYDDDFILINWDHAPNLRCVLDSSHPDFNYSAHESLRDARHKYGTGPNVMWFEIPDSREGWAKALELWENAAWEKIHSSKMLILDFTKVRAKGSPIHGMQNRPASGPVALMDAFNKAASLKGAGLAPWKQAIYLDHYFAECVLVGGARRAARMSTKHWSDPTIFDFITIKRPIEFRGKDIVDIIDYRKDNPNTYGFLWSSNNSVTVDEEFWELVRSKEKVQRAHHAKKVFRLICQSAYADGTGEPGIINSHKLVQKDDGWTDLNRGDYVGSKKYQINDDTQILMSRLAKRAKKKKYHYIVNPCGEIVLNVLGGYCTIADVVPYHCDTLEEAEEAFRVTTRALMRVNLMDSVYSKEVARTNRIGIGMTGVHEFAFKFFGHGFLDLIDEEKSRDFWLTMARFNRVVRDTAIEYSKEIGCKVPHTMTTIKPAGTTSKLFMLTEGWHLPSMLEFLRWVQFRNDDPLVETYRKLGYPVRELVQYAGTTIVGFPTAPAITQLGMGSKLVTAADASPEQQFKWLMLGEKYWIHGTDEAGVPLKESHGNQISYCLAGNEEHLVATDSGMKRIENGSTGCKTTDRNGCLQNVIDIVDNGIRKTITMRLKNGAELIGTPDHKVLVVDSSLVFYWKPLSEIVVGDVIVRRVGDRLAASNYPSLPNCESVGTDGVCRNVNKIQSLSHVTEDFGEFLGILMSDGSICENGISLHNEDVGVRVRFAQLVQSLFGLSSSETYDARTTSMFDVNVNSRPLSRWLLSLGVAQYHDDNSIPAIILNSPTSVMEAFVRGYTLDGHFIESAQWVAICSTTSRTMAKDLCSVLWNLGYDAYFSNKDGRHYYFTETNQGLGKDQYVVSLSKASSKEFVDNIGFLETRKNIAAKNSLDTIVECTAHKANAVPAERLQVAYKNGVVNKSEQLRGIIKANSKKMSMAIVREHFAHLPFVNHLLDPHLRFTEVESVAVSQEYPTHDWSIAESHEYVANSIVVHNTLKYRPEVTSFEHFKKMILKYQSQVRCCSVMPQSDASSYEYQPEQPLTSEEFKQIVSRIEGAKLFVDMLDAVPTEEIGREHVGCDSGACPVDFNSGAKD